MDFKRDKYPNFGEKFRDEMSYISKRQYYGKAYKKYVYLLTG